MDPKKQAICDALRAWINQRPGLEPANYFGSGNYRENFRNYSSERRRIHRQLKDARELLRSVESCDSITAEDMLAAFPRAFRGRLTCEIEPTTYAAPECPGAPCSDACDHVGAPYRVTLNYCTGQYWPTEYRAAAAAVLASVLWDHKRQCMPQPVAHGEHDSLYLMDGTPLSAGSWMRASFRKEYGATMQRRYFD
jgi:hypothetical protein